MAPGTNLSFLASELGEANNTTLPQKNIELSATTSKGSIILDASLITDEFDELRFGAAAFRQLDLSNPPEAPISADTNPHLSTLLISSPYNNPDHYLDLTTLSTSDLIFAKALTALKPTRPDYATAPYTEALDFSTILDHIRSFSSAEKYDWKAHTFYVVIFRSELQESIDTELLYKLDYESHREACESGGLLKYWFGKPDSERRNLATCFWRSREDAHKGGTGPWHKKARAAGAKLYEEIVFSTHRFTVLDGAREFRFEEWRD